MNELELAIKSGLVQPIKVGELIVSPATEVFPDIHVIIPFSREAVAQFIREALGRPYMTEGDCMVAFRAYVKAQCRLNLKAKEGKQILKLLRIY